MLSMNSPSLPPVELTDSAMKLAATLLQIAVDPNATATRLTELATATQTLRDAIALNETTAAKAAEVVNAQADVNARAADLQSREDALISSQTRLRVASDAISERDASVAAKELASDKRSLDLDARAKALDDRLASYRQALA